MNHLGSWGADLSGPTTKKTTFFMCVFPMERRVENLDYEPYYLSVCVGGRGI